MENLTKREQRVIRAFLNCIRSGEYSEDYAVTLIEDNARYGWLSNEAKDVFYAELEKLHPEPAEDVQTEPEPAEAETVETDTPETETADEG